MDGGDKGLGVVHGKRVDFRALVFPQTSTTETVSRILVRRAVPVAEIKGAFENADDIVVGLLAPGVTICDGDQMRVSDLGKEEVSDFGAPDVIEYLSIGWLLRVAV